MTSSFSNPETISTTPCPRAYPPPGWTHSRLKLLADMRSGEGITSTDIEPEGTIPVYGGNGIRGFTSRYTHDGTFVLIGRQGALCGNVRLVTGRFWASEHAVVCTIRAQHDPRWAAYLFQSLNLNQYSVSAAQPGLAVERVRDLKVTAPPFNVQKAIADFLDRKTAAIHAAVSRAERLAELMREGLLAHITRVVTGDDGRPVDVKPAAAEWLGSVPANWRMTRARFLFSERAEPPRSDDGVVTAFRDGQVILRERRRSEGFMFAEKELGYQHVCRGDLVVHSMDAFAGAIGVSEDDGKCSPEYLVLTPRAPGIHTEYFAEVLRVMARRGYILVSCPSVRERAPRMRFFALRDMVLPVPPTEEQIAIVAAVARARASYAPALKRLDQLAERLREYRQAIITAAVTGQLDVDARGAA